MSLLDDPELDLGRGEHALNGVTGGILAAQSKRGQAPGGEWPWQEAHCGRWNCDAVGCW